MGTAVFLLGGRGGGRVQTMNHRFAATGHSAATLSKKKINLSSSDPRRVHSRTADTLDSFDVISILSLE